jgi:hypothetical protein
LNIEPASTSITPAFRLWWSNQYNRNQKGALAHLRKPFDSKRWAEAHNCSTSICSEPQPEGWGYVRWIGSLAYAFAAPLSLAILQTYNLSGIICEQAVVKPTAQDLLKGV